MKVFTHNKPAALLEGFKQSVQQRQVIGGRVYETPSGKLYPSVTTVTGFKKKDFFAKWRAENPEESRRVLSRGNSLHKITEKANDTLIFHLVFSFFTRLTFFHFISLV